MITALCAVLAVFSRLFENARAVVVVAAAGVVLSLLADAGGGTRGEGAGAGTAGACWPPGRRQVAQANWQFSVIHSELTRHSPIDAQKRHHSERHYGILWFCAATDHVDHSIHLGDI